MVVQNAFYGDEQKPQTDAGARQAFLCCYEQGRTGAVKVLFDCSP